MYEECFSFKEVYDMKISVSDIMATLMPLDPPSQGFNFENCKRNALLAQNGYQPPKVTKTGTTICAVIFKDGVILRADTRYIL